MGLEGPPADENAIAVLQEIGVDLGLHKSAGLDEETLAWADWILVMELDHAGGFASSPPLREDRTLMLGSFGGSRRRTSRIPWAAGNGGFRKTRDELQRCVHAFMDQLSTRE
jgi:protein-tyrosine-phosphatase